MIVVDVPREGCLVSGPDAASYLHSQLSNDIASLGVGEGRMSFVLEPTGKVVALVRVTRRGDTEFLIDLEPGFLEALVARLQRFKIRVRVDIVVVPVWCVAVRSHDVSELAAMLSVPDGATRVEAWFGDAFDLVATEPIDPEQRSIVRLGSVDDLERMRVAATWPALGSEIVPGETLPAATGAVRVAVSFTKGCYPGQELVERMDSRGSSAPRSLRTVVVPPGTGVGSPVVVDGVEVGTVTSVSGELALAYVKRDA